MERIEGILDLANSQAGLDLSTQDAKHFSKRCRRQRVDSKLLRKGAPRFREKVDPLLEERIKERHARISESRDRVSSHDFESMRITFLEAYGWDIWENLRRGCFGGSIRVEPVPLATEVQSRFMQTLRQNPTAVLLPTFHGTPAENYSSICDQGFLIPDKKKGFDLRNGAWYGRGVYTSRSARCAGWYCSEPWMLVCAVVDDAQELACVRHEHVCEVPALSRNIKHANDQVIVFSEAHVVPLFRVSAESLFDNESFLEPSDFQELPKGKVVHRPSGAWAFKPPQPDGIFDMHDVRTKRVFEKRVRHHRRQKARREKMFDAD